MTLLFNRTVSSPNTRQISLLTTRRILFEPNHKAALEFVIEGRLTQNAQNLHIGRGAIAVEYFAGKH